MSYGDAHYHPFVKYERPFCFHTQQASNWTPILIKLALNIFLHISIYIYIYIHRPHSHCLVLSFSPSHPSLLLSQSLCLSLPLYLFSFTEAQNFEPSSKMESKTSQPMKKGKATLPPKRGMVKARICEEVVDTMVTAAATVAFACCGSSDSKIPQAFGCLSDEKKNHVSKIKWLNSGQFGDGIFFFFFYFFTFKLLIS